MEKTLQTSLLWTYGLGCTRIDKLRQIQYMMLGLFEYVYINIKNVVNAFWFIWKYFAGIKHFGTIQ
jgi:hypothetical protein